MHVIICFVFLCEPHTLPELFKKTTTLYCWVPDLFSLFSQLKRLPATLGQNKCEDLGTQMNPVTPAALCSNLPPSPLSNGKGRKRGQCSKTEVEIPPFSTPCFSMSFPQTSHGLKLTAVSFETSAWAEAQLPRHFSDRDGFRSLGCLSTTAIRKVPNVHYILSDLTRQHN